MPRFLPYCLQYFACSKPVAAPSVVASTPVAASKASDQPASRVATQVPTANMTAPSSGGLDATFAGVAAASALGVAGLLVATDPQKR